MCDAVSVRLLTKSQVLMPFKSERIVQLGDVTLSDPLTSTS